jgi:hypothetical protein
MRNTVATPVTAAAEATDIKRSRCTKLPFAPAVNALNMSVPTVPAPLDLALAAVVVIVTDVTFGVTEKIGAVFAGISYLEFLVF